MNRVIETISKQSKNIATRLADGCTTQDRLDKLHKDLDMGLDEYVRFQDLKSIAVMAQTLTLDEGMTIYKYLGTSPVTFNRQPLAIKVTLTELFRHLLTEKAGV